MPSTSASAAGSVLILGASRGLGLGLAREYLSRDWHVTATVRQPAGTGLHALADEHEGRLDVEQLDINDAGQIAALRERLAGQRFDVLFVNAGVAHDPSETASDISTDEFTRIMVTNALGPIRAIEGLRAMVPDGGTIAVMSSGLGSVARNETGGWEVYRASKAALNTLMRSFAARSGESAQSLLLIAPGWVRTDMGGAAAPLDVETSMRGVVDTITQQQSRPGLRYLDYQGKTVPW